MDVKKAAFNTLYIWDKNREGDLPIAERLADGIGLTHQHFVLEEVASGRISGEKAHRWLGWAQGYLCCHGELSLADCKYSNVFS